MVRQNRIGGKNLFVGGVKTACAGGWAKPVRSPVRRKISFVSHCVYRVRRNTHVRQTHFWRWQRSVYGYAMTTRSLPIFPRYRLENKFFLPSPSIVVDRVNVNASDVCCLKAPCLSLFFPNLKRTFTPSGTLARSNQIIFFLHSTNNKPRHQPIKLGPTQLPGGAKPRHFMRNPRVHAHGTPRF